MTEQQFIDYVESIEVHFHQTVAQGDEQELFVSSYLNGHFDLMVSRALNMGIYSKEALDQGVRESLQQAFDNNELEPDDQQQVLALWQSLSVN
ncbi:YfcL family protein [Lacimicrobium sp. SS2-24]|uniref:YfcL family protein n=1 Tax=Lacimicrobium sp. SS2-24 TaxID=2005569 RepID=UPI00143B94EC|nr:YfcL family protein [Lacimicrobium sp. SS2-24]